MTDEELRKIAENATPGQWERVGSFIETKEWLEGQDGDIVSPEVDCMAYCYGGSARGIGNPADAEFIATFNPETVLDLLDRVEKAEQELGRYDRRLERTESEYSRLETSHSILEHALQRVQEQHQYEVIGVHEGYGEEIWCPTCKHHYPCPTIKALDSPSQ